MHFAKYATKFNDNCENNTLSAFNSRRYSYSYYFVRNFISISKINIFNK